MSRRCSVRRRRAGLSWRVVWSKREGYRAAFKGFDMAKVAAMRDADVEHLVSIPLPSRTSISRAALALARGIFCKHGARCTGRKFKVPWHHG